MTKGKLFIVSTGPGSIEYISNSAIQVLKQSNIIVGYSKYINDIKSIISDKEIYSSDMGHEVERCKYAIEQTLNNKIVSVISNGDSNVYGMAGLILEIIEANNFWDKIEVYIEPGITALLCAASKAGAPLMNDFAVISLSDLLTPLETITKRIENALIADFVICLYNVMSHRRKEPFNKFLDLLINYCEKSTPVVIANNISRDNEKILIKDVQYLISERENMDILNMSTLIIVGNSTTRFVNSDNIVITPRGYHQKYDYKLNL